MRRESHDLVLGAGLAGQTAAHTLQQGCESDWLVLEKELEPGGHARCVVVDGYVFDFGPHILFSNDAAIEALIRDLLGGQHARAGAAGVHLPRRL